MAQILPLVRKLSFLFFDFETLISKLKALGVATLDRARYEPRPTAVIQGFFVFFTQNGAFGVPDHLGVGFECNVWIRVRKKKKQKISCVNLSKP